MGFEQIQFYCFKQKVGSVFHVMTNLNPLGEAVIRFFTDGKQVSSRPQACGSYTVLPDDNSTMSKDCKKLGWNGTHPDGKWGRAGQFYQTRILLAIRRTDGIVPKHSFQAFPNVRECDDFDDPADGLPTSVSAGDTWAIFVR